MDNQKYVANVNFSYSENGVTNIDVFKGQEVSFKKSDQAQRLLKMGVISVVAEKQIDKTVKNKAIFEKDKAIK